MLASLLILSACGEKSAIDAALQSGDVSGGPHRCALSGSITSAIDAINKHNTAGADQLRTMWSDLKAGGAQEAAYVVYAMNDSDCFATSSQSSYGSAKIVFNIVAKFDTEQHAMAAYRSGALTGGATPSAALGSLLGGQTGQQTGLGDNSWITSIGGIALASWSIDKYCSTLALYGGGVLELRDIAEKVKARE
jgi:hypothetical protein